MHELAVCQALVSQVSEIARGREGQVRVVHVGIGPLSGIEPHFLEQAYPLATAGTPASGSELVIDQTPVRLRCRGCGAENLASQNCLLCSACGDWRTDLISGDEMLLLRVELDVPQTAEADHV